MDDYDDERRYPLCPECEMPNMMHPYDDGQGAAGWACDACGYSE